MDEEDYQNFNRFEESNLIVACLLTVRHRLVQNKAAENTQLRWRISVKDTVFHFLRFGLVNVEMMWSTTAGCFAQLFMSRTA